MSLKVLVRFIFFLLLFPIILFAQKFGEISDSELQMKSIPEDPEANAVILFNKGEISITPDFDLEFNIHKRIKILTEAGKKFANVELYYFHEDKIHNLKAYSYTPNGKKIKLKKDDIFEERTSNIKKKIFAVPGVEIGSVIEYSYRLESEYIHRLEPWYFQDHELTKFSEIAVILPSGFSYSVLTKNSIINDVLHTKQKIRDPYDPRKTCTKFIWTAQDVPGIKNEPYMTNYSDYYTQLLFQLVSFENPYYKYNYAKEWDDMAELVWKKYSDFVEQNDGLKDFTKSLYMPSIDTLEVIGKIYDFVRSDIRNTDEIRLFSDEFKQPKDVYKDKEGNANEKNILLINLLKHAGLDAKPLLISKKSQGMINPNWVQLQQFNHVLVYLRLKNQELFLNTCDKYCPPGYLTPEFDVMDGLLIDEKKGSIIKIKPLRAENLLTVETDANLEVNNSLIAHSNLTYEGLEAVSERENISAKELNEYFANKLKDLYSEAVLDSFNCENLDSIDLPLTVDLFYHLPDYINDTGTIAYFTPPFMTRTKKNPFIREQRQFPVDYSSDFTKSETININFPDTYSISEKPRIASGRMENLSFTKIYFENGNSIECRRKFNLGRTQFQPKEYMTLRKIYDIIVSSDQDQIVLNHSE
ncbi:MAG: DUF3857 domain-containing protein [Calditrichaceae bacterium]